MRERRMEPSAEDGRAKQRLRVIGYMLGHEPTEWGWAMLAALADRSLLRRARPLPRSRHRAAHSRAARGGAGAVALAGDDPGHSRAGRRRARAALEELVPPVVATRGNDEAAPRRHTAAADACSGDGRHPRPAPRPARPGGADHGVDAGVLAPVAVGVGAVRATRLPGRSRRRRRRHRRRVPPR